MKHNCLFIGGLTLILFSCTNKKATQLPTTTTTTIISTGDCNLLLNRLFQGSSFTSDDFSKDSLAVFVNQVEDSVATIKIVAAQSTNWTVGWLELDLKRKKLTDITNDPEEPDYLKFDKVKLDSLLTYCEFKNTED